MRTGAEWTLPGRREIVRRAYAVLDLTYVNDGWEQHLHPAVLFGGEDVALIDCGYPGSLALLEAELARRGIPPERITRLLLTHQDDDHMGAAAELKARYPGIQVMASREEAPYISGALKNLRLQQAERMQARLPAEQKAFGIQFCERLRKAPSVPLDGLVSGGDTFDWGGGCEIVATPGHTLGHISVRALDGAFVVTGDAAVTEGQKLAVANPEYCLDMERAQASLEKLARYHSRCYICYHGGVWEASAGDGGTSHSH